MNTKYTTQVEIMKALMVLSRLRGSQKALAKEIGISPQYMNDILNGKRDPSEKVCAALGFRRVVTYIPIEKEDTE